MLDTVPTVGAGLITGGNINVHADATLTCMQSGHSSSSHSFGINHCRTQSCTNIHANTRTVRTTSGSSRHCLLLVGLRRPRGQDNCFVCRTPSTHCLLPYHCECRDVLYTVARRRTEGVSFEWRKVPCWPLSMTSDTLPTPSWLQMRQLCLERYILVAMYNRCSHECYCVSGRDGRSTNRRLTTSSLFQARGRGVR